MSKNISTTPPVSCTLCPRRCGADRAAGQTGFCGAGGTLKAARAALHFWEEPCISGTRGSGTVFFSGCTLKCCFCQNYPISAEGLGKEITIEHLAEIFLDLQEQGAHNINLVTPGQWRPWIIAALDIARAGVYMFTPIYIANYCENYCIYCGFNCHNKINRAQLNAEEIEKEMAAIAETGLQEILILTGESRNKSTVEYIGEACKIARKHFKVIGLEIYPVNSDEYAYLHECGADYVTVFQETYNSDKYETLHLAGHKRIFPYRVNAQERAVKGGMRGVGFGALLGLDDFRKDAFATGYHAYLLQRKYPHAEIAFSCPRLRPIINNDRINPMDVHEPQLLQVVCAYRLFMPFASITVSTRECARVRDNLVNIAATKISAGVSTGIGSHVDDIEDKGDDQFEISDERSVDEVYDALLKNNLQPVMSDYIYV